MGRRFARPLAAVLLLGWAAWGDDSRWGAALTQAGVTDPRIRQAMEEVRRADFLPEGLKRHELYDGPLPIGEGQTTSQPTLIAIMMQLAHLTPGCRVLEVGTGSGYQTALLAKLCDEVYSVEILEPLTRGAVEKLKALGYRNTVVETRDGYQGWKEHAPFDAIIVTAAVAKVPRPLLEQLKPGGKLVIPVESTFGEQLKVYTKRADGRITEETKLPVRFVPMTGTDAERDRR